MLKSPFVQGPVMAHIEATKGALPVPGYEEKVKAPIGALAIADRGAQDEATALVRRLLS